MSDVARLADIIRDFRNLPPFISVEQHVQNWIAQFPAHVQADILNEMVNLLSKTYFSETNWKIYIETLINGSHLRVLDVRAYWKESKFLNIQLNGNSQRDMLIYFDEVLQRTFGLRLDECGAEITARYIYIDEAIFSGKRVATDLEQWMNENPFGEIDLQIITAALYRGGHWAIQSFLRKYEAEKNVKIRETFWRCVEFENRKTYRNNSDVLWNIDTTQDTDVNAYYQSMIQKGQDIPLRSGASIGQANLFTSHARRELLENEFLKMGVQIRLQSGQFGPALRPLGFMTYPSFGFGSLFVTFRNCPNNCPLVLWVETCSWTPLLKRVINR